MSVDALEKRDADEASEAAKDSLVGSAIRRAYRLIDDGTHLIGGMGVAAGLCKLDSGDLRRCLDRNGRRLALDHAVAIAARIRQENYGYATRIGAAIVLPLDLLVFPRTTLTDKERADRLETFMRAMPMGDELVSRALGGTR